MFDDLNKKDDISPGAKAPGDSKSPQGAKDQPSSLGKPEETASPLTQPAPKDVKAPVADIFSETDKIEDSRSVKPDIFKPKEKKFDEPALSPAPVMPEQGKWGIKNLFGQEKMKKIIILILFILGLIIILLAGYWAVGRFFTPGGGDESINEGTLGENLGEGKSSEGDSQTGVFQPSSPDNITTPGGTAKPLDSDGDGLTDEEEEALGTDINSVDSDSDGLFDREEVKVYKTDPFNPDTDGDGFLDGAEVKDGYDPKGPGRLYEIK